MYDLFALSQLMDRAMDGYTLRGILQNIVGHNRAISFGVIYPLLSRLEESGFVTLTDAEDGTKRPRKIATITEAGRLEFERLMTEPIPRNQNTAFLYDIKFGSFYLISKSEQQAILQDYDAYLAVNLQEIDDVLAHLAQKDHLADGDRHDAMRVAQLHRAQFVAAQQWANDLMKEIG